MRKLSMKVEGISLRKRRHLTNPLLPHIPSEASVIVYGSQLVICSVRRLYARAEVGRLSFISSLSLSRRCDDEMRYALTPHTREPP